MITNQQARRIAQSWKGVMFGPLYHFGVTGSIVNEEQRAGIISEIILCKFTASEMSKEDVRELEQLRRYVESAQVVRKQQTV